MKVQQRRIRRWSEDSGYTSRCITRDRRACGEMCQPLRNISPFIVANVVTSRDSPVGILTGGLITRATQGGLRNHFTRNTVFLPSPPRRCRRRQVTISL